MNCYEFIATCRVAVGFLGEKSQSAWWPSAFLSSGSKAFMSPVFPRTLFLSQLMGTTVAAARVHDELIGIGHVFHLFRLPEDQEAGIQRIFLSAEFGKAIAPQIVDTSTAIQHLKSRAKSVAQVGTGPVRIASTTQIRETAFWQTVAGHYAAAFDKPNLNDGVLITASPLFKLFRLPKWRKDLEACWKELERGDYDWAHLALSIWPARVQAKCETDKSLAIAHDLEALYVAPPEAPKKKTARKKKIVEEEVFGDDEG